ncbi:hypothetical protein OED01_13880 [Microbacterium sp. M28]|uniref:hypothetical protein n=1 Tax=Microbacterium sp. M28 TaxID=2962064 RepID=UPI0021F4C807|nr:hypothetical protein [Microbacterium sp. M28]UYO96678.1 hypothetical protein OED01_13880 [Microbacterium sp. M28]
MQKLIWPTLMEAYVRQGSALLAGPAVRIADALAWRTSGDVLSAYGLSNARTDFVDVMRFEPSPVSRVSVPAPGSVSAAAGFGKGFLPGAGGLVPVWDIAPTEVPNGAELWRIHADGRQELVSAYAGPAFGWRSTGVYAPPSMVSGPRVVWNGAEYVASWVDREHVELVATGAEPPDGFEQTRPHVFRRVVAADACERLFEVSFVATWNGVPAHIVQSNAQEAAIVLAGDASQAGAGAVALEPGLVWRVVPRSELADVRGTTNELEPA